MIAEAVRGFLECLGIAPQTVLVACSGGADSTALLLAMHELGGPRVCAHVNHHLREAESDADETFVRELCASLGIECVVEDGTLAPAAIGASGIEAAAREVRESRLHEIAKRVGASFIATAHQKNDQAETVLMRLMTGTGLSGLRAIHPVRDDHFIRPLLGVTRREIVVSLAALGITPRSDRSNDDPRFLRNRVRVLLREFGKATTENLAAFADQARNAWPLVERGLDEVERACAKVTKKETRFHSWPEDAWTRQALLHRHIRRLGSAREVSARDLARLAASVDAIKRVSVTKDLELIRRHGALVLRRRPDDATEYELALRAGESVSLRDAGATLAVRPAVWREPRSADRSCQLFQLPTDADATFVVRNRRRGDRFRPIGLASDKKLKDFLIDRKIAPELRDRIPLLIWNNEIVWVAGVEISDRFKVTSPAGVLYEAEIEDESQERRETDILR